MRVMVLLKADERTEGGSLPTSEELNEMGRFNDQLVKAGIMLAGEGLRDSSKGKKVRFSGKQTTVVDGPFAETKELVSGFWIWQVTSMDEAVEWIKRAPFVDADLELRQVFEAEDFRENFTPEMQEQEQKLRDQIEAQTNAQ